ncbi:MAG TPA: hypothetical protein VF796_06415 [Humisphaera sp.]
MSGEVAFPRELRARMFVSFSGTPMSRQNRLALWLAVSAGIAAAGGLAAAHFLLTYVGDFYAAYNVTGESGVAAISADLRRTAVAAEISFGVAVVAALVSAILAFAWVANRRTTRRRQAAGFTVIQ